MLAACKADGIGFLSGVYTRDVVERIKEGVTVPASRDGLPAAEVGRAFTGRTMPCRKKRPVDAGCFRRYHGKYTLVLTREAKA